MFDTDLIVAGEARASSSDARFERRRPVTGEVVTSAAAATVQDAIAAADAAAAAFAAWSRTGPSHRRDMLLKVEQQFHKREAEIVAAMQAELASSPAWAAFNVHLTCGLIREAASLATAITGQTIPSDIPGMMAMTERRPVGVVLSVAPWNGPVILAARAIAMPLVCGNAVVLKGSEICPETHRLVVQCFLDAGLPKGLVNFVVNAPEDAADVVGALVAHKAIKRINFTGSSRTGRIIAGLAAQQLKPCLLELGGKSPMVILDDADLDEAARAARFGAFMNTGQVCMSTERIVVDQAVADDFVGRFVKRARELSAADPRQGSNAPLGPLALAGAATQIDALIDDAIAKGAVAVLRGAGEGPLMSPAIIDHVTPAMRLYHEESFGPVAAIVRVSGVEAAVEAANDTDYGLAASVFGRDVGRAMDVARRIDAGSRHVNMATIHDQPQMAFGGVKASGYGRFNGLEAIYEFTDTCLLTVRTTPAVHYPF